MHRARPPPAACAPNKQFGRRQGTKPRQNAHGLSSIVRSRQSGPLAGRKALDPSVEPVCMSSVTLRHRASASGEHYGAQEAVNEDPSSQKIRSHASRICRPENCLAGVSVRVSICAGVSGRVHVYLERKVPAKPRAWRFSNFCATSDSQGRTHPSAREICRFGS